MSHRTQILFMTLVLLCATACDSKKQDAPKNDTSASATATPSAEPSETTANADNAETTAPTTDTQEAAPANNNADVAQLPYNDKAPSGVEMKFPVTHALGWQDSKGENALVFAQQVRTEGGKSIQELQIRHARRASKEGKWETVRDFKELVTRCDGTAVIEVAASEWKVSDLDKDGVGEATFAYTAGCEISGKVPLGHKVLMIEDGEKYALRGTKEVFGDNVAVDAAGNKFGDTKGGDFKPDFGKAPTGFQAHAEKVWRATASVDTEPAGGAVEVPAAPPEGEFLDTHEVVVDVDTEETDKVTDCLSIWAFEDGSIEFGIELNFDLDHSCSLRGEASSKGNNTWVYKGSAATDDADCTLELTFGKDYVDIKDASGGCREFWCGARASLDGTRFPLKNKTKDTKKCGR
jgi:hypothetical protein